MDTETGEMIVKRVSVPIGLEELMEGLVKEVLLKKPDDIYQFAAGYFAHLLTVRDKVHVNKVKTLRSVQTIKSKPEKPPIHTKTKLSKQFSIREDSAPLDSPIISQKPKMYQRNELKYNKRRHTGPSTVIPNNQQLTIRRKYAKSVSGEIEKPATVSNNNKSKSHTRRELSNESIDRSTKTMNERNYSKLPILAENNIAKITENNNNNNNNDTNETNNKSNTETEENNSRDENKIVEKRSIEITKEEDNINKESLQKDEDSGKDNVDKEENDLQKDNSIKLEDGVNVSQKSENVSAEKRETYILTPSRTIDDEEVSRVLLSSISNTENSTVDIIELQNASPKNPSAIDESKLDENKLLDEEDHKMDETNIDTKENDQINNEEELKVDHTIKISKNDDENNQLKAEVNKDEKEQVSDEKTEIKEKEEIKIDDPVTTTRNVRETKIIEGELSEDSLELDEEKEKEEKPSVSPELPDITHNLLITEDAIKENEAGKNADNKPEELIKESENFTEAKLEDITENVALDEETKKLKLEVNENITNDLPILGIDHNLKSYEESVDTKEKLDVEDNLSVSSEPCDEKTDFKVNSVKEKNIEIETVPDIDKETTEDPKTEKKLKTEELSEETNKIENITKENFENTDADINNPNKIQNNTANEEENVKDDNINIEEVPESTTKLQVSEKENNNEENDIKISNKHDNADTNNADKEIRNTNEINEVNEKSTKRNLEKMITFDVEDNKEENVMNKFEKMATTDGGFLNNKRDSDEMTAKDNLEKMKTFDVTDITDKDSSLPIEIPAKNTENLEKTILKENSTVSQENNLVSEKIGEDKKIEEDSKLLNATLPTDKGPAEEEANVNENLDDTIENITKISDNNGLMNKEHSEKDVLKKENDKVEEITDENNKTTKFVATISNNEETETNNNKNENIDSENVDNKKEKINDTESKEQLMESFNNVNKIEDATVNNETNESETGESKESFDDVKIYSDKETKCKENMENEKRNQSFETGNNKTNNASESKEAIDAENINKKEDNKEINSLEIVGNTEQTVNASDSIEVPTINTENKFSINKENNTLNDSEEPTGDARINQYENIKVIETKEIEDSIKATEIPSDHGDSHNGNGENKTDNIEDNNQINTNENRTKRSVSFEESQGGIKDEDTYNIKSKSESDNNLVDRVAKNYVNYVIDNDRYLVNDSDSSAIDEIDLDTADNETETKSDELINENSDIESPGKNKQSIESDDTTAVVKNEEEIVEDTAIHKKDEEEDTRDAKDETTDVSSNKSKLEDEDVDETEHSTETTSNERINTDNSIIESPDNSKRSIERDNVAGVTVEDQMVEDTDINEKDKEGDRIHAKNETNEDAADEDIDRNESVKTAAQNLIQSTLSIAETSLIEHKVKTFLNDFIDKEKNNVPSIVKEENKDEVIEEVIKKDTEPVQNIKPFNKTMSSDSINTRPANGLKKTASFDSSKLRDELKKIEEESKFTRFKSSYNPFLLRKEIEDATEQKANDGLVLTSNNFTKVVNATLRIQRCWRRYKNRKSVEATMENKESTTSRDRKNKSMEENCDSVQTKEASNQLGDFVASANAAIIIQRIWRGFKARKVFKLMKNNVASKESSTKAEIDEESEGNCTSSSMAKENPDTTEENATEERRLFSAESTGSVNTVILNDPKDDSKTNHSYHNEYYSGVLDEILDYPTVEEEYLLDNYQSKLLDKISGKEEDNKFDDIKAYEKIVSPKRIDDINLEALKDEVHVPLVPKPVDKNERKLTRSLSTKLEILEEESAAPEEEEHTKDSESKLYTFCSEPTPIQCEKKLIDVLSQNTTEEAGSRKQETLVIPLPTEVKNKLKNDGKQEICDVTNLDDISSILSNAGIDCGEIHDTVVVPINEQHVETGRSHPISVQLYQTSDAENLMTSSSSSRDVTGGTAARDAENAQDPEKADLRVDSQFADDVLSGSPPHSMESEKRRKIDGAIMEAQAATKIQAGFRGYQVRKQLKLKNGSSDMTNSKKSTRSKSTGSLDSSNNQSQKPEKIEEQSAVKIQAGIRGFLVRRRQKKISTKQA